MPSRYARAMSRVAVIIVSAFLFQACNDQAKPSEPPTDESMVWLPGGEFVMGSEDQDALPDESPPHRVRISGFWIDRHEVTNRDFAAFVADSGYVTTAERAPTLTEVMGQLPPGATPPAPETLVPGALVFASPPQTNDGAILELSWWRWVPGASWRHPLGPDHSIEGLDDHPVVQVSWDDAAAYAAWADKALPTEAEWEYAARGGLARAHYVWGDEKRPQGPYPANIWQGSFPRHNALEDGHAGTAPVESYAPNGYGLFDMSGNVWEWVADWYRPDTYTRRAAGGAIAIDPQGPDESYDPQEPYAAKRVTRGGSFLCADSYCIGYRPSARMKTSFDTGLCHTGFRCVRRP
ncbi:MAG: formylglycine-generating enzyme family protein [Planctomycetes bacterium]|nr:formylglycine-generating enzyme family protein [Planctomycetota bacterium]